MHPFDRGTHLEPLGGGIAAGHIEPSWWIDKGPNGGYLASLMLRGMAQGVDDETRSPRSLTVHYMARPVEGDVEVHSVVERVARTMTFVSGRLMQEGKLLATAQAAFSARREAAEIFSDLEMPEVTPPEDIPELPVPEGMMPPFAAHFDYRWALGSFPYSGADKALTGGWLRTKEPRPVDDLILPTFSDGWPPAVFSRRTSPALVPTIDLTVHFRASEPEPSDDWVLVRFEARVSAGGFLEEDGYIWARDGRLLAHSRQLALY